MAMLQCVRPQTASTVDILKETNNGNVSCSRRALFGPKRPCRHFTKLEVFLVALLVFLVVVLVVTVLMLTLSRSEEDSRHKRGLVENPSDAIQSLAQIVRNMDSTIDPCEDFYQYACGGWLKKTYIEDWDVSVFTFKQVQRENRRMLKEILENKNFRSNYSRNPSILKVFDMYSSCMNTTAIEKFGDFELAALFSEILSPNSSKSFNSAGWDEVVVKVKRKLGLDMFFTLEVLDDLRNSSKRRIVMRAVQLGLDQIIYLAATNSSKLRRQYYLEYMTDVMELVTSSNDRASVKKDMTVLLDLESKIAKTQLSPDQRRNFSLIYNLVPIKTLTSITSKVDWLAFFRKLTFGAGYLMKGNEELLITSPKMIREIVLLLSSYDSRAVTNYIKWNIVRNLIDVLPKKYGLAYRRYQSKVFSTELQDVPRWTKCIEATSNVFPVPTAILFTEHVLHKDRVNESKKIMSYVKEALLNIIPHQVWLDKKSQSGAIEKAEAVIFDVAYPDNRTSASPLTQTNPNFTVSNSNYFATNLNVKSFMFMEIFKSLKTPVDRREFEDVDPLTPTATYYFTRNKVGFSAGFLRDPFYNGKSYKSLNFGALGMAVGHEMTHGFDQRGYMFDKNGYQRPWMSRESIGNLSIKTSCFSKQYSQFKYKGQKINGNIGVHQSFADSGGLKLAFEAYKLWKRHNSEESVVAGLKLTNHQLFFLSYAQMWCSKYKETEALRMISSGPYLPSIFRVRGSLMNSLDFSNAFSCPTGSAMNPQNKCEIW